MTMTRERIEELKRKVAKTTNGYMMLVEPEDVDALLALAERALEPKEPVLTAGNFPDSAQGQLAQKAAALPLPNYTASKLALEPQGQALPVVAWLTEWPKDRIRNAGKLVELAEPEQKFSMNHYEPLVRLSDARSYASQLALPAGPVPEGFVLVPMHLNAEMREVLSEEDWTWEDLLVAANAVTEEQYYAIQNGDDSSPAVAQPNDPRLIPATIENPAHALSAPAVAQPVADDVIREIFMAHGFTIKEGQTDLKPYVYAAARALLARAALGQPAEEGGNS
ncbi:hypothetical protein [Herbaspirillum aquaticum]|uniref:hypothetical protein n=1 Tax=Herbaspirillum aquaticum TaxID=568783 RepID=UPI0024DED1D8|nr:hypothetical protein [Herbaspirillum aquaticum]